MGPVWRLFVLKRRIHWANIHRPKKASRQDDGKIHLSPAEAPLHPLALTYTVEAGS